LTGKTKLDIAKGENTNPFYQVPKIRKPMISEKAKLNTVQIKIVLYMIYLPVPEKHIL